MESEWLDLACINHVKYIVHGELNGGMVGGFHQSIQVEKVLDEEEKAKVDALLHKHQQEFHKLLKSFVA
jgi:hypothetical protein